MQASPSRSSLWLKIGGGLALVVLVVAGFLAFSSEESAPDVTYTSLTGEKITSESLRGKVVMVNFWATSCATCIAEMPQMVQTYNKYKEQGLEFVAVAMSYDPPNYVLNYVETRKLPFIVTLDSDGGIAQAFGNVQLTPTTFIIDKHGKIIKRYVGQPEFAALHQLLEKELAV